MGTAESCSPSGAPTIRTSSPDGVGTGDVGTAGGGTTVLPTSRGASGAAPGPWHESARSESPMTRTCATAGLSSRTGC
jgi:hypothetical protein